MRTRDGNKSLWGRIKLKRRLGRGGAGEYSPSETSKSSAPGAMPSKRGLFGALRRKSAKHRPVDERTAQPGGGTDGTKTAGAAPHAQGSSLGSGSSTSAASPMKADAGPKAHERGLHESSLMSPGGTSSSSSSVMSIKNRERKNKQRTRGDAEDRTQRFSLSFGRWNLKTNKPPEAGMQQQQQQQQREEGTDETSVGSSPMSTATSAEPRMLPALQPSGEGDAEDDAPSVNDSDDGEFFDASSNASWYLEDTEDDAEDDDEGPDSDKEQSAPWSETTIEEEAPVEEAAAAAATGGGVSAAAAGGAAASGGGGAAAEEEAAAGGGAGGAAAADRGSAEAAGAVAVAPSDLRAHRAAFGGDTRGVVAAVKGDEGQIALTDTHGNTALHIASIRGHLGAAEALVAAGAKVEQKNGRGWTALDEAISLRDRQMVAVLYRHRMGELKSVYKAKKAEFIENLDGMADFKLQMSWELGSNYFGYLLRRVAPNDTYDVYKWGNRIRVDGTLMGIDDKSKSLIPEWKRGHFSVLFLPPGAPGTAGEDKSKIVLVNRVTNEWIDLSESKKEQQRMTGASSESREVSMLMRDGAGKTKMKTSELKFKPVKTWTGGVYKEKVCGWNTTVYEAQARLVAITTYKTPMELPEECSFEEYLSLEVPEDAVQERPVDPLSMEAFKKGGGKGGAATAKAAGAEEDNNDEAAKKPPTPPRKVTSRLWMAHDFPLSLHELLPVLDIIGHANKHIQKVSGFMRKYGERELFPVKVQVPLMMTVFALVSFKGFSRLEKKASSSGSPQPETEASFYEMPPGCTRTTPEKMFGLPQKRGAKRRGQGALPDSGISGKDIGSPRVADLADGEGQVVNHGDPDLESWEASLHYSEHS